MSDELEDFMHGQFPFRPSTKDWQRLQSVVAQMETMKAAGVPAAQAYADIVDVPSVAYLAANRAGMNAPEVKGVDAAWVVEWMANAWVEGFAYGVLFEREGGHQEESEAGNPVD